MSAFETGSRFTVTLDPNVPLERLLLQRLQSLTRSSRHAWLRSLMVEGFLRECRVLECVRTSRPNLIPACTERPPSAPYTLAASPRFTGTSTSVGQPIEPLIELPAMAQADGKPFAHLRRVIG